MRTPGRARHRRAMLDQESDCLWLILENKRAEVTFPTSILKEIDWKTRGFLSRVVCGEKPVDETVFIPVYRKLPSKMCAIDTVKTFEPARFQKNIEGLKAQKVVVVFENGKVKSQVESELTKLKMPGLFKGFKCIEDQA